MFKPSLGKEASWLLPFGLIGLLLLIGARPSWPLSRRHQAALLWGGWLLTALVFFSIAEFFHEDYLLMIAPPLAALVGSGAAMLWRLAQARRWRAWGLLITAVGGTLALQQITLGVFAPAAWWRPLPLALALIGVAMAGLMAGRRSLGGQRAGYALAIGALLITPLIWSVLTMRNPSDNQSLPGAYAGVERRAPAGLEINQALLDYLAPRTQASKYLLAVPSAMQGSDYVISTGRPVLYLGGFLGTDSIVSGADLSALVERGELRYLYWGASTGGFSGPGGGNAPEISRWVQDSCRVVSGFDSVAQNFGAPGGTLAQPDGAAGRGSYQIRLYDCAPAGGE
jgi:4-amino-4-deoxy-L-arabinose transferase-like glycosyltransferase